MTEEDDQLAKDGRLFFYVRENRSLEEKKTYIRTVLDEGANVNACDLNNNENTCLHIAARKLEMGIVQLLVERGALLRCNSDRKSPIDVAKDQDNELGNEIAEFLEANVKFAFKPNGSNPGQGKEKKREQSKQITKNKGKKQKNDDASYAKRVGTSGASGQFYETKILSLVLYRSLHDSDVVLFYMATNIKDIGDFDDVCFRCKVNNQDRHMMMFLQAKHRDDPEKGKLTVAHIKNTTGDFGLGKYYDSFLRIRQKFSPSNPDPMFQGEFKDIDCHFILYTPVKNLFEKKRKSSILPQKLNSFINTCKVTEPRQEVFQYENDQSDISFLTNCYLKERVNQTALDFFDFIMSPKEKYDGMMTNHLIKIFHPALARYLVSVSDVYSVPLNLDTIRKNISHDKKFKVSELQPEKYRIGQFRSDFFYSSEDILHSIKDTLCRAIVINHCKKTNLSAAEIKNRINKALTKSTDETISNIIGEIVTYDEKNVRLNLNESTVPPKLFTKEGLQQIKNDIQNIQVTPAIIKDAIFLAGKPKLELLSFKLPTTFGNSDLSIRGNMKKSSQNDNSQDRLNFVSKLSVDGNLKLLASVFINSIMSKGNNYKNMLDSAIIQSFHQDLARHVIIVSETFIIPPESLLRLQKGPDADKYYQNYNMYPETFCLGQFQPEFFDYTEKEFINLRAAFSAEIINQHCKESTLSTKEMKRLMDEVISNPNATTISLLIGEVLLFDDTNNIVIFNETNLRKILQSSKEIEHFKTAVLETSFTPEMVKDAITMAGVDILKNMIFKLPIHFGKANASIQENESEVPDKVLNRISFLAKKIVELINTFKDSKVIEISNETVGPGKILESLTLETNGGIGGAVGNLLILDHDSGMLVFNSVESSLPVKAKILLRNIESETQEDLTAYKISVNLDTFPRYYFHANQYEQQLAQEFLDKLWFYTSQAKEDEIESLLKGEIDQHYNANKTEDQFLFRVHSDAIFLRFHDEIQKWWKLPTKAPYLTEKDKVFEIAKGDIIDKPLLTVLNVMCNRKLNKIAMKFKPMSLYAINLDSHTEGLLNIITDAVLLSAIKINQLLKDKYNNTILIDLQYLFSLPLHDYNTVLEELKVTTKTATLVLINEIPIKTVHLRNKLNNIFVVFNDKKIIMITEKKFDFEDDKYCVKKYYALKDEFVNLVDLTDASQSKFLEGTKITYQGEEVPLIKVIDVTSEDQKRLVTAKLISSQIDNKRLEIGHALSTPKYEEIRNFYTNRLLRYDGVEHNVNKLTDIPETTVIVSGKPCSGKTMLLTHLALQTKIDDSRPWIVRVNLPNHNKHFESWKYKDLDIDVMMKFLCEVALKVRTTNEVENITFYEINDECVALRSKNNEQASFELKLFMNLFNDGQVIILFDSFDKLYPEHIQECMKMFTLLSNRQKRFWVTTSTYFSKMLEREFGTAYKLERLTTSQQQGFLHRFWKTNMKLEKLNHEQFSNITCFFQFISRTFNIKTNVEEENRKDVTIVSLPLHIIYVTAVEYFKNELINFSPKFIRDEINRKWRLDSFTDLDRYLRKLEEEEERSSDLAGTPLHMYFAASYFEFQIKDRLILKVDEEEFKRKFSVYFNAATCYENVLLRNIKQITELEDKQSIEKHQGKIRDDFFEKHKKLALYAICKESDMRKLLTEEDIDEVKTTINRIESGEEKNAFIDCVIDGVPRFYNLIFAEYFCVEFLTHLLKTVVIRDPDNLRFESAWDGIVNGLLLICPPGVRNAFEYKLKYDPELVESTSTDRSKKVIFDLIVKQEHESSSQHDANTTLNTAINDGLVHISNLLLSSVKNNITPDNMDVSVRIIKSGALLLSVIDPSWKDIADNVIETTKNIKSTADSIDASQIENVSKVLVMILSNTDVGKKLNDSIKNQICEPVKKLTDKLVESSAGNENLTKVLDQVARKLPDVVNALFGK